MLDGDDFHEVARRDEGHDRWRAMQSAYAEYTCASEALECTRQSSDCSSTDERLQLTMLEGRQRLAFERYLEARMEFLECRFDESNRQGATPQAGPGYSPSGNWWTFAKPRALLEILAVVLLCTTAFSVVREKQQVGKLEKSRDGLQATLDATRAEVRLLDQKVDSGKATAAHQAPVEAGTKHKSALPAQQKQTIAKKGETTQARNQKAGGHGYYRFSLAPSRQYTRVGPIEVSLRAVDPRQRWASLFIVSNRATFDVQRAGTDQPVWINVGPNQEPLELVVDRIAGNHLEGHLIETKKAGIEPRDNRLKSAIPASPS